VFLFACAAGDPERPFDPNAGSGGTGGRGGVSGQGGSGGGGGFENPMGGSGGSLPGGQGGGMEVDPDAGCGATSVMAEQVIVEELVTTEEEVTTVEPVALYVMLDQSMSMNTSGLWVPATNALRAFVDDASSAGVDVALDYFPSPFGETDECTGGGYDMPSVAPGRLPAHAPAIHASLDTLPVATGFGTPIEGALRGATSYCQTFQANNVDEKCVAVLVTDGEPFGGCSEDFAALAQIAADARTAGVTTFAVGLEGADFALLDMIAMAGGGEDCSDAADRFACDVSSGAAALSEALEKIRDVVTTTVTHTMTVTHTEAVPLECEWEIPEAESGAPFDKKKVNVELAAPSGTTELGQVEGEGECAELGWHYDDAEAPTRIIACEEACELIQSTAEARVDIVLGCPTLIID
jgi:Mg-chelatase subunit ChlD